MRNFDCPKLYRLYNLCFWVCFFFCLFFSLRMVEFCTTLVCKHCHVAKAPFTVASVDAVVIGTVLQYRCKQESFFSSSFFFFLRKNCQASKKKKCLFKHSKVLCR